ncbi:hypothetical protein [uncultured Clostridium sp.]|jgi:hypothetical protein|nr:hypothetical protein [uncultured Clostridium sp.]
MIVIAIAGIVLGANTMSFIQHNMPVTFKKMILIRMLDAFGSI